MATETRIIESAGGRTAIIERPEVHDESDYMTVNMGPQHPSTHGVLRVILTLDGETVVRAEPDIGYLHTGIEKTIQCKRYEAALTCTDRMDYLNPLGNNLVYCLAVEKLLGLDVPPRAQWLRTLLVEMTRITSHLVWLGTHAMDLGAMTVFLYCFREREQMLDLFEELSGGRVYHIFNIPGGVRRALPQGFLDRVTKTLDYLESRLPDYDNLMFRNAVFVRRATGTGAMTQNQALEWGVIDRILSDERSVREAAAAADARDLRGSASAGL